MLKTALNTNIIPHIGKLANLVPIPKTQQRNRQGHVIQALIPPLSNCKDTGEEPYSLHNSKHTKHTHATRVQNTTLYRDGTQHRSKGFNQTTAPARTITVTLDMSKTFDTINIHTLIRKLLQTKIPGTIIKFIANNIKGRKAYTTGVPQGGILLPTQFNIHTADIPPPRAPIQVMAYADHITITSTHTQARVHPRNTYNHTYIKFLPGQNKTISH